MMGSNNINYSLEMMFRVAIFILFSILETAPPFMRAVQTEEIWLYRNPKVEKPFLGEFGGPVLRLGLEPVPMVVYPFLIIFIGWIYTKNTAEAIQMCLIPTLSTPLTGTIINILKIAVGRPRPNFMVTCYGISYYLKYTDVSKPCTGDSYYVMDGRKSFPSGHSGLAFASFGFIILYIKAKGRMIWEDESNRWKVVATFLPLLILPTLVAISRTCDYKHHWQDILVGSLIGSVVTYLVFNLYCPTPTTPRKDRFDSENANPSFQKLRKS